MKRIDLGSIAFASFYDGEPPNIYSLWLAIAPTDFTCSLCGKTIAKGSPMIGQVQIGGRPQPLWNWNCRTMHLPCLRNTEGKSDPNIDQSIWQRIVEHVMGQKRRRGRKREFRNTALRDMILNMHAKTKHLDHEDDE